MKKEFQIISELIENNKRVLDVGCGDGTLMKHLKDNKNIDTRGLEISKNNVQLCISKSLSVIEGNAEKRFTTISRFIFRLCNFKSNTSSILQSRKSNR